MLHHIYIYYNHVTIYLYIYINIYYSMAILKSMSPDDYVDFYITR